MTPTTSAHASTTRWLTFQEVAIVICTPQEAARTEVMVASKNRTVRSSTPPGAKYRPENVSARVIAAARLLRSTSSPAKVRSSYSAVYLFTCWNIESWDDHPVPKPRKPNVTNSVVATGALRDPDPFAGTPSASPLSCPSPPPAADIACSDRLANARDTREI